MEVYKSVTVKYSLVKVNSRSGVGAHVASVVNKIQLCTKPLSSGIQEKARLCQSNADLIGYSSYLSEPTPILGLLGTATPYY